jgi:magnesium transporter
MEEKHYQEIFMHIESFLEDEDLQNDDSFKRKLHSNFLSLHGSEQADLISDIKIKKRARFIELIISDIDPEILIHLEKPVLQDFVDIVGNAEFGKLLSGLNVNLAVLVLDEFSKDFKKEILEFIQYKKRIKIKRLLSYPEDSVGRSMNMDYFSIQSNFTVKETMDYLHKNIKSNDKDVKNIEVFVTDEEERVIGSISIFDIIKLRPTDLIKSSIRKLTHIFNTYDDISEAVEIFIEYHLQIAPIIDVNSKLVGVLEINNVANLIKEEAEKSLLMQAGVFEAKKAGIFWLMKARFTWLFINFLTASAASSLITFFEPLVASFAVLAVLTPIVASIGGNTGNQGSTVIIRSLATKEFEPKLIIREILVSGMNSIAFSLIAFLVSYMIYQNPLLSLSFGLAIFINLNTGGIIGTITPLIVNKFNIDPALCSSIFITMITDMMGFFSFLGIAYMLLS